MALSMLWNCQVLTAEGVNRVQGMGKWYNKNKQQLQGLTELIREKLNKIQRKASELTIPSPLIPFYIMVLKTSSCT
eukprot:1037612-Amphidinium_carterae.2